MIRKLLTACTLTGLAISSSSARASFITGSVDFTGTAVINGSGPLDATAFTSFTGVSVVLGAGSYSGTPGTAATIKPFSFNPAGPVPSLWSFNIGPVNYSFDLGTMMKDFQGTPVNAPGLGDLRVSGTGVAHITGYSDTPSSFVLHASGALSDLDLAFGASDVAGAPPAVPDSGDAAVLLSGAFVGIALLGRKLAVGSNLGP